MTQITKILKFTLSKQVFEELKKLLSAVPGYTNRSAHQALTQALDDMQALFLSVEKVEHKIAELREKANRWQKTVEDPTPRGYGIAAEALERGLRAIQEIQNGITSK